MDPIQPSPILKKNGRPSKAPRLRRSLEDVQADYDTGKDPLQLEKLVLAFKGIQELPYDHPQSFFHFGGYHGAPFRGPGRTDRAYWGGYCHHGNVLFPVWHRIYCFALEDALRSIKGCEDVTLPYWDQTSEWALKNGIPSCVTDYEFTFKKLEHNPQTILNPLRTFQLPIEIVDETFPVDANNDGVRDIPLHSKPKGYEVKRFPHAGLVGSPEDIAETQKHNAKYPDETPEQRAANVKLLNENVRAFMKFDIPFQGYGAGTYDMYLACLQNPNYTSFSNTTSTDYHDSKYKTNVVSLEHPHNMGHSSLGAFSFIGGKVDRAFGSSGDMGSNETAGFDPIFYFHHCFVDYVFWQWQKIHKATENLEVLQDEYPGVTSLDHQGPSAGFPPGIFLTMETPLTPFKKDKDNYWKGRDTFNIYKLGYDYDKGSLASTAPKLPVYSSLPAKKIVEVLGLDKSGISGSFLITVSAVVNGAEKPSIIGVQSILSRWNVKGCMNCQAHLEAKAYFSLPEGADENTVEIEVTSKDLSLKINQKDFVPPADSRPKGLERFRFHIHDAN